MDQLQSKDSEWSPESLIQEQALVQQLPNAQPTSQTSPAFQHWKPNKSNRKWYLLGGLMAIVVIAMAVGVPVFVRRQKTTIKDQTMSTTNGGNNSNVFMEDGSCFTYLNNYGGEWAWDPQNPFGPGGRAQNWSKAIGVEGEKWEWGRDIVRGVNLGGWLVTQPYITPALYEKYFEKGPMPVVDEWSLSLAMGDQLEAEMENHYSTFITEQDFASISAAGLNFVRIPIGFWAIETRGEPFLARTSWKYFLKAIQWGRKYGIRIYLDLHGLPGSQNGWDHSGRQGEINMMHGTMGVANAQRTLSYLQTFTQFISQKQYAEVVPIIGVANDVRIDIIGEESLRSFYKAAYSTIRNVTGIGAGKGPFIAIHDGFQGVFVWENFLNGADRLMLDQHPFIAFNATEQDSLESLSRQPCNWALATNRSSDYFGVTVAGQFSAAVNDCGLWVNGIGPATRFKDCDGWNDYTSWSEVTKSNLRQGVLASMDALQNWFFWTWKVGAPTNAPHSAAPMWDYRLGLANGWIPLDPRESIGHCASVLGNETRFDGGYPPWSVGGDQAGRLSQNDTESYPFPPTATFEPHIPASLVLNLPTYTPTGIPVVLPGPNYTAAPDVDVGSGWFNANDTMGYYVPIEKCSYPDAWHAIEAQVPSLICSGS